MTNIWKQSPVDIFEYSGRSDMNTPKINTQKLQEKIMSDTSSLQPLTESTDFPIYPPDRIVLPIQVDSSGQLITPIAVGSCEAITKLNVILIMILMALIIAFIIISINKYTEYRKSYPDTQDTDLDNYNSKVIESKVIDSKVIESEDKI
jgi:hypothetical protein